MAVWLEQAIAPAIEPVHDLYIWARNQGIVVFFVSGRSERFRAATERNLKKAGYLGWSGLFLKPRASKFSNAAEFKIDVRRKLVEQGHVIVLNLGDQPSDLEGGYAERTFLLPNPLYRVR